MDEMKSKLDDWIQMKNELKAYDTVIDNFLSELERESLASHQPIVDKTPKRPKKKRILLSPLIESDVNESIIKTPIKKKSLKSHWVVAKDETGLIVPSTVIKIEVSSDEDKSKMPPPSQPLLKTKITAKPSKKLSKSSTVDKIIPATEIKQEKSETTETATSNLHPKRTTSRGTRNTNTSYECNVNQQPIEETVNQCSVVLIKITASDIDSIKSSGIHILDSENVENITFDVNSTGPAGPENTFVIEKEPPDTTFVVPQINETVTIDNQKENQNKPDEPNNKNPREADKNIQSPEQKKVLRSKPQSPIVPCMTRNKKNGRDLNTPWGANTIQLAAEENKRKRVEKQKQVQEVREANERKKRDDVERLAHEREEKYKNLLRVREKREREEYEKKKILREQKLLKPNSQRNLKEVQNNLEIPKYNEKKRDVQTASELPKTKLADNKENYLLSVAQIKAKHDELEMEYDFDILLSGDSTDDETQPLTNKPPPPAWSLTTVREPVIREQNYIQLVTVDKLFSVQPMTIDLQEIFPTIDTRYLLRNSSVIWPSPQKCEQHPKL